MGTSIEVRIGGRGKVRDGVPTTDTAQGAKCDLCGEDADAVASTSADGAAPFACKSCLRVRLEAMTVGSYLLREGPDAGLASKGLPWGKVSG